jgi:hypothetical protein
MIDKQVKDRKEEYLEISGRKDEYRMEQLSRTRGTQDGIWNDLISIEQKAG